MIAYFNLIKNDYSNYNCSDSITNEIIKKGNETNKKELKYNMITTFTDGGITNESEDTKNDINTTSGVDETPYYDIPK